VAAEAGSEIFCAAGVAGASAGEMVVFGGVLSERTLTGLAWIEEFADLEHFSSLSKFGAQTVVGAAVLVICPVEVVVTSEVRTEAGLAFED